MQQALHRVQNKRKHNKGESLLVAFKTKGKATRRGLPLLITFKTKGNEET